MTDDFLNKFQECIDRDEPIGMDTRLADIPEWDSLSAMAFIGLANAVYSKKLKLSDIEGAVTVSDLYALLS